MIVSSQEIRDTRYNFHVSCLRKWAHYCGVPAARFGLCNCYRRWWNGRVRGETP